MTDYNPRKQWKTQR